MLIGTVHQAFKDFTVEILWEMDVDNIIVFPESSCLCVFHLVSFIMGKGLWWASDFSIVFFEALPILGDILKGLSNSGSILSSIKKTFSTQVREIALVVLDSIPDRT